MLKKGTAKQRNQSHHGPKGNNLGFKSLRSAKYLRFRRDLQQVTLLLLTTAHIVHLVERQTETLDVLVRVRMLAVIGIFCV